MALRTLEVERFRGIRTTALSLGATTVLLGENDCGRSSLFEALALVLSPDGDAVPRLRPGQFHREGGPGVGPITGPVRIRLTLAESKPGSWDRPALAALAPVLGRRAAAPRTLTVELTAPPPERDRDARAHWEVRATGGRPSRDDPAVLAAVRRMNPLIWLRSGGRVGLGGPARPRAAAVTRGRRESGAAEPRAPLRERVPALADRMLDRWAPETLRRDPVLRAAVAEILGPDATPTRSAVTGDPGAQADTRSTAQRLGYALVAARIVEELRRTAEPGTRPLLVVEDPEAHLHPMTLASVGALLERFPAQKLIATQSGTVLSAAPLRALRRLTRDTHGVVREWRVGPNTLSRDDTRKVGYHLRARRGVACFARCWLLVEGETEFWVLPDLARLAGHDLAQAGVVCVEFAQCGLPPLVKLADALGIRWHVIVDGDRAGDVYARSLERFVRPGEGPLRLTRLADRDIEHCFWRHGHAAVFRRLAGGAGRASGASPTRIIRKAIERHSKPGVAFELLAALARRGDGGPPPLRQAIETCVRLAAEPPRPSHESATPSPRRPGD